MLLFQLVSEHKMRRQGTHRVASSSTLQRRRRQSEAVVEEVVVPRSTWLQIFQLEGVSASVPDTCAWLLQPIPTFAQNYLKQENPLALDPMKDQLPPIVLAVDGFLALAQQTFAAQSSTRGSAMQLWCGKVRQWWWERVSQTYLSPANPHHRVIQALASEMLGQNTDMNALACVFRRLEPAKQWPCFVLTLAQWLESQHV